MLITDILKQGSATYDPAKDLLGKLENEVEQKARKDANLEIGEMLRQLEARKAATIVIPQIPAKPPAPFWLADVATAQRAQEEADRVWQRAAAISSFEPKAVSEPIIAPQPETFAAETQIEQDQIEMAAPMVAAGGGNDWFGHNPEGLPLWMTAGIPLAAVSAFAIGMVFMDRQDTAVPAISDAAVTTVSAVHTGGAADNLDLNLFHASADAGDIVPVNAALGSVPSIAPLAPTSPAALPDPVVAAAQPLAAESNVAPIAANYIVREKINPPVVEEVPTAPSAKPELPTVAPVAPNPVQQSQVVAPKPQKRPIGSIPERVYSGNMPVGSAAHLVNAVATKAGSNLTRAEQVWLASDMERALEDEIDGRSISLRAKDGQRIMVNLDASGQVRRELGFARVSEISSLPHNMVIKGGWFAAKKDIMLQATPAIGSGLIHRTVEKDQLIERLATYTDHLGMQWYLMGQRGLAVGFISPADLTLAGARKGQLGSVYAAVNGETVYETRHVYTTCRSGYIGPFGESSQSMMFCRNANGNWVSHLDGQDMTEHAGVASVFGKEGEDVSSIILAEALGDPVASRAFSNRKFRRRIQADLVNAKFGQSIEHVLPDGTPIRLTFGEKYTSDNKVALQQVDSLAAVPGKLKVDAEWVKAPIGATLRATPDYLSEQSLTEIPAGEVIEKIGHVEGTRGDEWILVGRSGVGFGYVNPEKLTPLGGRVAPHAVKNERSTATFELVDVTTTCIPVAYKTTLRLGTFIACQQTDGSWALKGNSNKSKQFADGSSGLATTL